MTTIRSGRVLMSWVVVLALGAPPAAAAATDPPCPPALCDALEAVPALPFDLPDVNRLATAASLTQALEALLPDMPRERARVRTPGDGLGAAIRVLRAGAARAEAARDRGDRLGSRDRQRAFRLLQRPRLAARPGEPNAPHPGLAPLAAHVDLRQLTRAAAIIAAAADDALATLRPVHAEDACEGSPTPPQELGDGSIAVDTAGSRTVYEKPYTISIDLGGCDVYRNVAGGATGTQNRPVGIALDLGPDADDYEQPKDTYGLGGASGGIGLLVDQGGNDRYRASSYASMGAGILGGVGILADLGGDDAYEYVGAGGGFGTQGNGTLGFGALVDLGGDDLYRYEFDPGDTSFGSRLLGGQGVGTVGAIGVLGDAGGDDRYRAITYGNTVSIQAQGGANFLPGCTGILVDAAGDDEYLIGAHVSKAEGHASGAAEGQGIGVLDGNGLLLDGSGDDTYAIEADGVGDLSASVAAGGQGFATAVLQYSGVGALVDRSGDDAYSATAAAHADDPARTAAVTTAQGMALFFAGGILADLHGADTYRQSAAAPGGYELSAGQGAGLAAATGVLVDGAGADRYAATGERAQGYGASWPLIDDLEVPGGTGILVDGAGRNAFTGPGGTGSVWTQGADGVGVGIDAGRGGLLVFDSVDAVLGLMGLERPHAVVTSSITSPADLTVLHGDVALVGTANGGPLGVDWVEWRADAARWTLAERSGPGWSTWTAALDVDALADGDHEIRARAWAGAMDSAAALVHVTVERWLPAWDVRDEGDELVLGFDLATRGGEAVDDPDVALQVLDAERRIVTELADGLSRGGGRYEAGWTPPAPGTYVVRATVDGQLLGEVAVTA